MIDVWVRILLGGGTIMVSPLTDDISAALFLVQGQGYRITKTMAPLGSVDIMAFSAEYQGSFPHIVPFNG